MDNELVSVGIDVGKGSLVVGGLERSGECAWTRTFANSAEGIAKMITHLDAAPKSSEMPCVIESTSDYHVHCCCELSKAGYKVNCINPVISKRHLRYSVRSAKTDRVDAARLAEIGILEKNLRVFDASVERIALRRRVTMVAGIEWSLQGLKESAKRLADIGGKLDFFISLNHLEEAVRLLELQREKLMEEIEEQIDERAKILAAETPGVSLRQAAILSAYLSDKTFATKDALVAYSGIDIRARRSSQWRGREKLSKRGPGYLRKTLYLLGWELAVNNDEYRTYYYRLKSRRLHHTACVIAVARRFLRVTWWRHYCGPRPVQAMTKEDMATDTSTKNKVFSIGKLPTQMPSILSLPKNHACHVSATGSATS